MEEKNNFWRSRVEFIEAERFKDLQHDINDFCNDRFVVGIQYPEFFQSATKLVAVISYKVKEGAID